MVVPESPVWNWHIDYLCDELQKMAIRVAAGLPKEYDMIINISPGSTKSTICSVMFPPWLWSFMNTARSICGSHSFPLAMDLSRKSRDIVRSEKYQACFPKIPDRNDFDHFREKPNHKKWKGIELRADQDTKSYFANTAGGSRYAVGVGGSVIGMHGHFLIVDDPIDPTKAVSEVELKTANRWMNETLPTRKVDKRITPTILIMQRLHQDDPSANMIEKAQRLQEVEGGELKLKHICLPAELTDKVKPITLRSKYKNGLMDPVRLSRKVLNEHMMDGQYSYAGQFLQWPVPLGGGMFKTERIIIDEFDDKWVMVVRYWDKAGTADGGAYTVGLKMGVDRKKRYWILDVKRGQWDSSVRERVIRQTAEVDGKKVKIGIEQEPGSGGKESAQNTVRNLAGWSVKVDRPTGDKATRADPYSVQVNNGNVHMLKVDWNTEYLNELAFFPFSKYKDQVDTSSGAFNMLVNRKKYGALSRMKDR